MRLESWWLRVEYMHGRVWKWSRCEWAVMLHLRREKLIHRQSRPILDFLWSAETGVLIRQSCNGSSCSLCLPSGPRRALLLTLLQGGLAEGSRPLWHVQVLKYHRLVGENRRRSWRHVRGRVLMNIEVRCGCRRIIKDIEILTKVC